MRLVRPRRTRPMRLVRLKTDKTNVSCPSQTSDILLRPLAHPTLTLNLKIYASCPSQTDKTYASCPSQMDKTYASCPSQTDKTFASCPSTDVDMHALCEGMLYCYNVILLNTFCQPTPHSPYMYWGRW